MDKLLKVLGKAPEHPVRIVFSDSLTGEEDIFNATVPLVDGASIKKAIELRCTEEGFKGPALKVESFVTAGGNSCFIMSQDVNPPVLWHGIVYTSFC